MSLWWWLFTITFKPVLKTTCVKRPPVLNDQWQLFSLPTFNISRVFSDHAVTAFLCFGLISFSSENRFTVQASAESESSHAWRRVQWWAPSGVKTSLKYLDLVKKWINEVKLMLSDVPFFHSLHLKFYIIYIHILVQVRLATEVLRTPSLTRPGFELMTSRSWQYTPVHFMSLRPQVH